jgi:rhamnosyltransferase
VCEILWTKKTTLFYLFFGENKANENLINLNFGFGVAGRTSDMQHVFIIGSKGIPAKYGGFETFVEKLTEYQADSDIKYHVACISDNNDEFEYNGAHCFNVKVPEIGAGKAVLYDIEAFKRCLEYIRLQKIESPVVYVLACRIGPFIGKLKTQLLKVNGTLYVNPDGHEWMRAKWNWLIRRYWKHSEKLMVKYADLLICDSQNIEEYIKNEYANYQPRTTYIAYGCDSKPSTLSDTSPELIEWYQRHGIKKKEYYLAVGRFVPENNFETMIREFMRSDTDKDFVLITNIEKNKFYETLRKETGFEQDGRIKFVGTVYNQELLKKIRENAYAYLHGHSVGGTNPSLIEALGSTDLNLLYDVGFNREVGGDGALYWSKEKGSLTRLINKTELMEINTISKIGTSAKKRMSKFYNWNGIVTSYEEIF